MMMFKLTAITQTRERERNEDGLFFA